MDAKFNGPSYTLGVEEELMILDGESFALANEIDAITRRLRGRGRGQARAAAERARDRDARRARTSRRPADHVRRLRREVSEAAAAKGLAIGSAGTHPSRSGRSSASPRDPRYRELIAALKFIARQEIIFGLHVHVGIDDPEKAIHVANGMRVHVPILLALSANSPYWRSDADRARLDPDADLPRLPARRHPAPLRELGRLREPDRLHGRRRRDGRRHLPLVRRPAASAASARSRSARWTRRPTSSTRSP